MELPKHPSRSLIRTGTAVGLDRREPRLRTAARDWLPAVVIGLLPVVWFPWMVDSFILPRAALAETGAGLLVAAGAAYGRSRTGILAWALLGCALAAGLAAVLSSSPSLSLVGAYTRYESLPMRLAYCGLCWGTLRLSPPASAGPAAAARWRGRIEASFLAGCGVAAAEAVVQALLGLLARPDGNLGQPGLLGALLAMALPLAATRLVRSPRWAPLAALLAVGLGLSTSRAGWLGALAGLAVWATLTAWHRRARAALPAAAAGAAVMAGGAALVLFTPVRLLNQDTGAARLGVWRDGLRLIAARPWFGWGEEGVGLHFGAFQTADWQPGSQFDRLHSMPLDLLATQGVAGLAACTLLFCLLWRRLLRLPGAEAVAGALAAYLVWSLLDFDWVPATAPLWLLAGAALAGSLPPLGKTTRRSWAAAAGLAALLLGILCAVPPLVADTAAYAGRDRLAATVDPLQPRYHAAIGTPAQLAQAVRLGSDDPQVLIRLGNDEARRGREAAARRDYRAALALYPYARGPFVHKGASSSADWSPNFPASSENGKRS